MKTILNQIAAEFRQLPGTLGKLVGGITVCIGTLDAVLGYKHDAPKSIAIGVIALGAGVWLFARSSAWLSEQKGDIPEMANDPHAKLRLNVLAWGILACVVVVFLLSVHIIART